MYNKQITLNISGTKLRQAGFADFVILGAFPEAEFKNMDRATLISEKPVYLIKHTSDYIFYQLIDRGVKSYDADTNGVLSIAITIPSDMQLAGGKSPYTLLKSVYDRFRSDYMTPYSDGRDTFLNVTADATVFSEIVANYPLERRVGRYVVMNAVLTGQLGVSQDKLEALFRDSQYPEFANYKDVEIGTSCESSFDLASLEIPRPIIYDVYVNGTRQPIVISKPTDLFSTNLPDHDNISFTLGELLVADGNRISRGKSVVELDFVKNKITCNIAKSVFMLKCKVMLSGKAKDAAREAIENGKLKIIESGAGFDIMQYRTAGLEFEIPSDVILNPVFRLEGKENCDLELAIFTNTQFDKRTITVDVNANPKQVATVVVPPANRNTGRKEHSKINSSKSNKDLSDQSERQRRAAEEREREKRAAEERYLQEQREKEQKRNGFLMGFFSALVLCGLCFAVYCFWPEGDEQKKQPAGEGAQTVNGKQKEVDKVEIFSEVLKDTIKKDEFYKGNDVKQIVEKYNKIYPDTTKAKEANTDVNGVAQTTDNHVEKTDYVAIKNVEKALEKSKKQNEQNKDQIKAEILELVKKKDLNGCMRHSGWNNGLNQTERNTVDFLLRTDQYNVGELYTDKKRKNKYSKAQQKQIMDFINNLDFGQFQSWEDLENAKDEIVEIRRNSE